MKLTTFAIYGVICIPKTCMFNMAPKNYRKNETVSISTEKNI